MEAISNQLLVFVIIGAIYYILYLRGYMIVSAKRAVVFVGNLLGRNKCSVNFSSCNGYVKRIVRFYDDGEVRFDLEGKVTKGNVQVEILDVNKQRILLLDCGKCNDKILVQRKKRYYLILRFENATGELRLNWNGQ